MTHQYLITAPGGFARLLQEELDGLGFSDFGERPQGLVCRGPLIAGLRACMWSRLGSRVLLRLAEVNAADPDALYESLRDMAWEDHLRPAGTLVIHTHLRKSSMTHAKFASQRAKDAIVDRFVSRVGSRPSVDKEKPDVTIDVRVQGEGAEVYVDLSGEGLHRRGYRLQQGAAPLKEHVAAAVLWRAGWPALAAEGRPLVDPMCGSGTLLIEGAMMALDIAPGLGRRHHGHRKWLQRDDDAWTEVLNEARERKKAGAERTVHIAGADADAEVIRIANINAEAAGIAAAIQVTHQPLSQTTPIGEQPGLVAVNPPYGERLGTAQEAELVHRDLGAHLKSHFPGWQAAVITQQGNGVHIGLSARKRNVLNNGPIECELLLFDLHAKRTEKPAADSQVARRLEKNKRKWQRWAKDQQVSCYRVYDRDLPDYAAAIDRYGDRLCIQEYEAPKTVPEAKASARLHELVTAASEVFGVPKRHVYVKRRRRQRGADQYVPESKGGERFEVLEGGHRFVVNLEDYLHTGLFLDSRRVRALVAKACSERGGGRFLNLFAYTASASVYAAAAGARTTSVDLSRTYLRWGEDNFRANGIHPGEHQFVASDTVAWLPQAKGRYDVILLDPPTFSNSKSMEDAFEVQRHHAKLITDAMALLNEGGVLFFCCNARKFTLDATLPESFAVKELTRQTASQDFSRGGGHWCWQFQPPAR